MLAYAPEERPTATEALQQVDALLVGRPTELGEGLWQELAQKQLAPIEQAQPTLAAAIRGSIALRDAAAA